MHRHMFILALSVGMAAAVFAKDAIRVIAPNEGGCYKIGDTMTISWEADFSQLTNGVQFGISHDNGLSWLIFWYKDILLVRETNPIYGGSNIGVFKWKIPATIIDDNTGEDASLVSSQNLIKVEAPYDYLPDMSGTLSDVGDALFAIKDANGSCGTGVKVVHREKPLMPYVAKYAMVEAYDLRGRFCGRQQSGTPHDFSGQIRMGRGMYVIATVSENGKRMLNSWFAVRNERNRMKGGR